MDELINYNILINQEINQDINTTILLVEEHDDIKKK